MSLSCILIDDDPADLESLYARLQRMGSRINIVNRFSDLGSALSWMAGWPVDAVFVSIDMCGNDGMKFTEESIHSDLEIVFTAANSHYPIANFRAGVSGCLSKPVKAGDLEVVVRRLERRASGKKAMTEKGLRTDWADHFEYSPGKIKLPVGKKILFLEPDEVLYCESEGNYCKVILRKGSELFLTRKLKQVEALLPPHFFYRVHNSFLINLRKVREFHKNEGVILLENGERIPVSRQKREELLGRL